MNRAISIDYDSLVSTIVPSFNESQNDLKLDHGPRSAIAVVEGVSLTAIFLGAVFANVMAMTTILADRKLRKNDHNWLILNLVVNDLGIAIFSMSFTIWSIYDNGYLLRHNPASCTIHGAFGAMFIHGNFATIVVISLDRYLTIVWSSRFPPSKPRTISFLVVCWVIAISLDIPPLSRILSDFKYSPSTHHCSPVWDTCYYYVIIFVFIFGVTVPIMAFCYAAIACTLHRNAEKLRSHAAAKTSGRSALCVIISRRSSLETPTMELTSPTDPDTKESLGSSDIGVCEPTGEENSQGHGERGADSDARSKKAQKPTMSYNAVRKDTRVALTGFLLVATTLFCWAPYFIVHSCFTHIDSTHSLSMFTMWLAYTNSLLDPLIYSFMSRQIRARYNSQVLSPETANPSCVHY